MAGINVIDPAGTDRALSSIHVVDAAGTDRTITQINVIDPGGTDRVVWNPGGGSSSLVVSVSPEGVHGQSRGSGFATTDSTTATASGGTGPYTYSWSCVSYSNDSSSPIINLPSSATTTFTQSNTQLNQTDSATFLVTAKDSVGATATVEAFATWSNISKFS